MKIQRRLEKISTIISLAGLALGFSVLGLMIVVKEHDGGAAIIGGILGILLGAAFLIAACLHWKGGNQIQGGFQVEEVPAAEIVSEMRRSAEAICSF
jgi:peptidoglycan/LPS O-acetylase OafA/YrhL